MGITPKSSTLQLISLVCTAWKVSKSSKTGEFDVHLAQTNSWHMHRASFILTTGKMNKPNKPNKMLTQLENNFSVLPQGRKEKRSARHLL